MLCVVGRSMRIKLSLGIAFSLLAFPASAATSAPSAPTIGTVYGGNALALVTFTPSTGATSYTASCKTGTSTALTKTGSGTVLLATGTSAIKEIKGLVVTGLTNTTTKSTSYSCSVTATNSSGTSSASSSKTTYAANVAPSIFGALPGDSRISIAYNFAGGKIFSSGDLSTVIGYATYAASCISSDGGASGASTASAEYASGASSTSKGNYTNPIVVSGLTNGKSYTCRVTESINDGEGNELYLISTPSSAVIPNAGPANTSGVLASTKNTSYATSYPTYASYCAYVNQSATAGRSAAPSISYYNAAGTFTTGTNTASISCSGTTTRTIAGNALPDHRSSEFFTNGLSGYTSTPYNSGNPNRIGIKTVSKSVPYTGTISEAYSAGSSGYDTSECYKWTATLKPTTIKTYYNSSDKLRCTYVSYPSYFNNSVKVEPDTAETYIGSSVTYNVVGKNLYQDVGLDPSNAHNQPTGSNFYGYYHYHGMPEGLIARIGKGNATMTLVGFAADGFPIYARYGYKNRTNTTGGVSVMKSNYRLRTTAERSAAGFSARPSVGLAPLGTFEQDWIFDSTAGGTLDACNGRYGVTPESNGASVYHYFVTDTYPFIPRCMFGKSVASWANDVSAN